MNQQLPPTGPPYAPKVWQLGGKPTVSTDIAPTAVFLALFLGSAIMHMTIFQINRRRNHKFIPSLLLFIFSMSRVVTMVMRISSISLPKNGSLALAAQIFTNAGIVILFIIHLTFAQRVIRATHPHIGWHPAFTGVIGALIALIVASIIIAIVAIIQQTHTLNPAILRIDRKLVLYAVTVFAIISFLPIPMILFAMIVPKRQRPDKFGSGRLRTKYIVLLFGSTLACLGASYRAGTAWLTPVPLSQPLPGYFSKAPFYIFNFTLDIIILYTYAITRVDQRFHIPNGAKGTYSTGEAQSGKDSIADVAERQGSQSESAPWHSPRPDDEDFGKEGKRGALDV